MQQSHKPIPSVLAGLAVTATRRPAADLVGYSRLMGADEEGTLERLARREVLKVAEFG
jgi:hypothetical protein